jgi:hypothetical protein
MKKQGSAFQRACQEAAQEVPTEEDIDKKGGKRGEQRACHLHVPGDDLAAGHVVEGNGDGPGAVAGQDDREKEIIPRRGELPDEDNHEAGDGDGQENVAGRCRAWWLHRAWQLPIIPTGGWRNSCER